MHSNRYTLIFVFIVTVVLGTILSFTKENLREDQENNSYYNSMYLIDSNRVEYFDKDVYWEYLHVL